MMTPAQIAENIVKALDDKKGRDIRLMKTDGITVLADYFAICTATSAPHIKALTDEVDKRLSELGEPPIRREGYRSGSWVLLDFGCVIVHLFQEEARQFYNLERLWNDAETVDISKIIAE
ncbi:MAG: ribosome silencing factor [Candidatus Heteroscillospira sp.]